MKNTFASLGVRNFRLYFLAQSISLTGTWIQTIALSWLAYELTGSSSLLGLIVATQFLPLFLFGVFGGHIADRYPKHTAMVIIQTLSIFPPLVLSLVLFFDIVQIWILVVVGLLQGILRVFDNPVRQSFISFLVPKESLKNAVSLYTTASNIARLIGPAIAAYLLLLAGAAWSFFINALSFAFVVLMLLLMHKEHIRANAHISHRSENVIKKVKNIFASTPLRNTLLLVSAVGLLVFTSQVTFPVFATEVLGGDVDTYGFMFVAVSVGSIIGGLYAAHRSTRLAPTIASGMMLLGAAIFFWAFSHLPIFTVAALVLVGFFLTVVTTAANTFVRECSDDSYLGTSMALWSVALVGTGALGNVLLGYIIELLGIQYTIALVGILVSMIGFLYTRNVTTWKQ